VTDNFYQHAQKSPTGKFPPKKKERKKKSTGETRIGALVAPKLFVFGYTWFTIQNTNTIVINCKYDK